MSASDLCFVVLVAFVADALCCVFGWAMSRLLRSQVVPVRHRIESKTPVQEIALEVGAQIGPMGAMPYADPSMLLMGYSRSYREA